MFYWIYCRIRGVAFDREVPLTFCKAPTPSLDAGIVLGYVFMAIFNSFVDLVDRLSRIAHAAQFADGLNPAQWETLRFLSRANRYSASPGALADYLGTTKGTASQTLIALEAKGLVERMRTDTDRRKVRLALTKDGRALLARDPLCLIERAGQQIPDQQRALVMAAMNDIVDNLCRQNGDARFGVCGECCHLQGGCQAGCTDNAVVCGLTGETLGLAEIDHICVNFSR